MSGEQTKSQNLQDQKGENMSSITHKPQREPMPAIPAFSYAQAAKGKSPAIPTSPPVGKALSDTTETDPKKADSSESGSGAVASPKIPNKRTVSEGRAPEEKGFEAATEKKDMPPSTSDSKASQTPEPSPKQGEPSSAPQKLGSTPSSPDFGATSTSTLPKDEDMFPAGNGSSDSTWDKQSQSSQNGNKSHEKDEKAETEKESSSKSAWDEEPPAPAPLKEAPPPTQNIWQQRKEAQEAKAKSKQSALPQISRLPSLNNGSPMTNGTVKNTEIGFEGKKQDGKRRAKTMPEDKLALDNTRGLRKDGKTRSGEEDKPDTMIMAPPPPPPGDELSWPTPDSVVVEEKKKPQERSEDKEKEKEKSQAPKPHGRKGWTPVEFVPTPVFETPLPQARRGGRGPFNGGRENVPRGRNNPNVSIGAERSSPSAFTSTNQTPTSMNERARAALGSVSNPANSTKSKRASSAGPTAFKEQRKSGDTTGFEKQKESDMGPPRVGHSRRTSVNESRKPIAATVPSTPQTGRSNGRIHLNDAIQAANQLPGPITDGENQFQYTSSDAHLHAGNSGAERKSEGSVRPSDTAKEPYGNVPSRERGEGRPDRGRGGHRGRGAGNHAYYNSNMQNGHAFSNGPPFHYQPSSGPQSRSFSNHERIPSQSLGSFYAAPTQTRNFRSGSRSHSMQHSMQYGRFSNGLNQGPGHLAHIQTDLANMASYQPENQGIMTALPAYGQYYEQISQFRMVTTQMEYYFSVDNLCKDMFLRKHMDSQGYVFLSVVANFNRIKQLTTDMEMIRYVCLNSPEIEVLPGPDVDRLRARKGWQQWVLSKEERDPSAQNDGPVHHQAQMADAAQTFEDRQVTSPQSTAMAGPMESFQYQSLDGYAPSFSSFSPAVPMTNGAYTSVPQTPWSAGATEFSPSSRPANRGYSAPENQTQETNAFTDEQVDNLHIVVRKPAHSGVPPFQSLSTRTFSNGSIDGRKLKDELSKVSEPQPQAANNSIGSESPDVQKPHKVPSPLSIGASGRQGDPSVCPPVLWIKNKEKGTPFDQLPNDLETESYHNFRQEALKEREQGVTGKPHSNMQNLYNFWAHFLIRNFNCSMYQEFRRTALEDATKSDSSTGLQSLMLYYDEALLGQKTFPDDQIARDFVDIVKSESSGTERPAFKKLRAAWRNGAFNHKNRAKVLKMIDSNLKEELDR